MKIQALVALVLVLTAAPVFAGHLHLEKEYQAYWCDEAGGVQEVVLDDRSRVDCVTDLYAVEVEFAPKWKEAVGQSLFYSLKLNKKPGIVLILEDSEERKYLDRLRRVAERYDIAVWAVGPEVLNK